VLEWRFPVRLESFEIRRGSGGKGRFPGGDGVIRRVRFDEAMTVSLLTGHRRIPPYGLDGGEPGQIGSNRLQRKNGMVIELDGCGSVEVGPGDLLIIETPGGGGWGDNSAPD